MCQKWIAEFSARDFLLDDAPQLGRPMEVDNDQIETSMENNQHSTLREIDNILKISKSIKLWVKVKNVPFILQKKLNRHFGQPILNLEICLPTRKNYTDKDLKRYSRVLYIQQSGFQDGPGPPLAYLPSPIS